MRPVSISMVPRTKHHSFKNPLCSGARNASSFLRATFRRATIFLWNGVDALLFLAARNVRLQTGSVNTVAANHTETHAAVNVVTNRPQKATGTVRRACSHWAWGACCGSLDMDVGFPPQRARLRDLMDTDFEKGRAGNVRENR